MGEDRYCQNKNGRTVMHPTAECIILSSFHMCLELEKHQETVVFCYHCDSWHS